MNKQDFFTIMREGLNDFPKEELDDILKEYEKAFNEGISQGKTEEEIINNLGNPFMIINKYRNNYLPDNNQLNTPHVNTEDRDNNTFEDDNFKKSTPNYTPQNTMPKNNNNLILKIIIVALVLVILGPFLFAAFGVIIGVLISLIAVPFSILVGGTAFLFGKIGLHVAGFTVPSFLADFPMSSAALITLGSLFATILFIILTYYFIKLIVLWIKKLFSRNSNKEV